jgi:hypothetical protein
MNTLVVVAGDQCVARSVIMQSVDGVWKPGYRIAFIGLLKIPEHYHSISGTCAEKIGLVSSLEGVYGISMTRERMQLGDFDSHYSGRLLCAGKRLADVEIFVKIETQ